MTVIDASALVAFVLREEQWESIEAVLREGPSAPELLPTEAANAVLTARRRKRIDPSEATEALHLVQGLSTVAITLVRHTPLLEASGEIAIREDISIYDALYIALARRERTVLASRDRGQLSAAKSAGVRSVET